MRDYKCRSFRARLLAESELSLITDGSLREYDYTIIRFDPLHQDTAIRLRQAGFVFLDRYLRMEISVLRTRPYRQEKATGTISLPVTVSDHYDEEMEDLACRVYTTDRRFHLDERYDAAVAGEMIHAYLQQFKTEGCPVISLRDPSRGCLLGFTVLRRISDNSWENVMGLTTPGIKGKLAASCLYNGMLEEIAGLCTDESAAKYIGMVSSENVASINLHTGLGATVSQSVEEYICRRSLGFRQK